MRRKNYRPYLFLAALLLICLNLPFRVIRPIRAHMIYVTSPFWKNLSSPFYKNEERKLKEELEKLQSEKGGLIRQNQKLKEELFSEKNRKELQKQLELEASPLFSRVIYREPAAWSSFFWIDVGERDNERLGFSAVSVNSPVLSGDFLVGVIDHVGKKQSRVRLITDASLVVSVRAVRGEKNLEEVAQLIDRLILNLEAIEEEENVKEDPLLLKLETLRNRCLIKGGDQYLAKGELLGTSSPLWRSRLSTLKGIGFHCDFEDERGVARELRTGKPYDRLYGGEKVVLIQKGDSLVTTGMEGIFPPNLGVGVVTKVDPLEEGAASFSIEAQPYSCFHDLSSVTVLPSLGFNMEGAP
jgi:rod shape-determining protein MreC